MVTVAEETVIGALRKCYDPEIPVNLYDLGLIYGLDIEDDMVYVAMTLTSPGCPVVGAIAEEVQVRVCDLPGVNRCDIEIVWDPPWTPAMLRPEAREVLDGLI